MSQDDDSKEEREKNLRKESDPCTQDDDSKEEREKNLRKDLHELDVSTNVGAENGLFKGKHDKKNDINDALKTTRKSLDKHDISETETNHSYAWGLYSDALNSTKWHWRMLNLHAIHIWIYLIAILVSIFSI